MLREPVLSGPYGVWMFRTCRSGDCAQKMGLPSPVKNYILYRPYYRYRFLFFSI